MLQQSAENTKRRGTSGPATTQCQHSAHSLRHPPHGSVRRSGADSHSVSFVVTFFEQSVDSVGSSQQCWSKGCEACLNSRLPVLASGTALGLFHRRSGVAGACVATYILTQCRERRQSQTNKRFVGTSRTETLFSKDLPTLSLDPHSTSLPTTSYTAQQFTTLHNTHTNSNDKKQEENNPEIRDNHLQCWRASPLHIIFQFVG